jgi:hypothetical protein
MKNISSKINLLKSYRFHRIFYCYIKLILSRLTPPAPFDKGPLEFTKLHLKPSLSKEGGIAARQ